MSNKLRFWAWSFWFVCMWFSVVALAGCWGWKLRGWISSGEQPPWNILILWIYNSVCQCCVWLRLFPGDYVLHRLERSMKSDKLAELTGDTPDSLVLLLAQPLTMVVASFMCFLKPTWYPLAMIGLLALNVLWLKKRIRRNGSLLLVLNQPGRQIRKGLDIQRIQRLNDSLEIWSRINEGTISTLLAVVTAFLLSSETVAITAVVIAVASMVDWLKTWRGIYIYMVPGNENQL